jgi:hypothetical protein
MISDTKKGIVELKKMLKDEFTSPSEKKKIRETIKRLEDEIRVSHLDKTTKNLIKSCKKAISK